MEHMGKHSKVYDIRVPHKASKKKGMFVTCIDSFDKTSVSAFDEIVERQGIIALGLTRKGSFVFMVLLQREAPMSDEESDFEGPRSLLFLPTSDTSYIIESWPLANY